MPNFKKLLTAFTFTGLTLLSQNVLSAEFNGLVQVGYAIAAPEPSYQSKGTSILRHDDNGAVLQQALVHFDHNFGSGISIDAVANYYTDGNDNFGLSQAQLHYKPLMASETKFKARAGFFYPEMSLENVDIGWLSPFTYTQSAINSWIGEELKAPGIELSLFQPSRLRKSPWAWQLTLGAYKGNDPLGTMLAWRGWAMHDRQTLHTDRVEFAPYPSVINRVDHPSWVEPFHEIDGKYGYYIGAHLDYRKRDNIRYYFYDNQGDPSEFNGQRLYAWRTKFHSLAWQHKFNPNLRLITQLMSGTSEMGDRNWVYFDFDAWYVMLSGTIDKHRISARFDKFSVRESDIWPWDYNDSDGNGFTLAWRYSLNKHWQLGIEQHFNQNNSVIRKALQEATEQNQSQTLFVAQYRF